MFSCVLFISSLLIFVDSSEVQVSIEAVNVFGARHALETLFQLMTSVTKNNASFLMMVNEALIRDGPIYPHRGLLVDSSRHYLSVNTIKRTLDAMGHSKLNVFHWHATDTHSFPLKLPQVPKLAEYVENSFFNFPYHLDSNL